MKPEGGGVAKVCRAFGLQQPLVWAGGRIKVWNKKIITKESPVTAAEKIMRYNNNNMKG